MDLTVTEFGGNSQRLTVDQNATVSQLKQLISPHFNVNPFQQKLSNNHPRINLDDDSKRLSEYGVTSGSTIGLIIINQVFVRNEKGKTSPYEVNLNDTVDKLQRKIFEVGGVLADQQRLIYGGKQLESGRTLQDYNIEAGSTIDMSLRLRGGQ